MRAGVLPFRYYRPHDVPGLEAEELLLACPVLFWKAVLIRLAHLALAPPGRFNEQGCNTSRCMNTLATFPHASRIQPVRFGVALPRTVVFGAATCADFQWQP